MSCDAFGTDELLDFMFSVAFVNNNNIYIFNVAVSTLQDVRCVT